MKNSSAEVTFQPVDVIGGFFDLFDPTCSAQIRDFFFQTEIFQLKYFKYFKMHKYRMYL